MSVSQLSQRSVDLSAHSLDGDIMFNPKWLVLGSLLGAAALIANYDRDLGIAAGVILGMVALGVIWFKVRLWMAGQKTGATREALAQRYSKLTENRRRARSKELSEEG